MKQSTCPFFTSCIYSKELIVLLYHEAVQILPNGLRKTFIYIIYSPFVAMSIKSEILQLNQISQYKRDSCVPTELLLQHLPNFPKPLSVVILQYGQLLKSVRISTFSFSFHSIVEMTRSRFILRESPPKDHAGKSTVHITDSSETWHTCTKSLAH